MPAKRKRLPLDTSAATYASLAVRIPELSPKLRAKALRLFALGHSRVEYGNKYFGSIKSNHVEKKKFPQIKFMNGEIKDTIHDSVQIPGIFIGYKIPGLTSAELPALEILASILGESKSSRLYSNTVYKKNLAKSARAFIWDNELGGLIIISCMGFYDSVPSEIEKNITETVGDLITKPVDEAEIEKAKNSL